MRDAQPGKILHESRDGEMAQLGEVPFGQYYGSVDSTPLFVMLAAAHYRRTGGSRARRASCGRTSLAALTWIETYGDVDGDGLIEYMRRSPTGLVQQGWKDSHDSVRHADGSIADRPDRARARYRATPTPPGSGPRSWPRSSASRRWPSAAARARGAVARRLRGSTSGATTSAPTRWRSTATKRPCQVRTSNPGHCLFAGLAAGAIGALRTAETLLAGDSFSGWGVRTVSAREVFFNPMSYHNGSVWPHDSAIVAAGLARYQRTDLALAVLQGLFDATTHLEWHRLPELFCGFERRPGVGPTSYPVACAPQAWAAGAAFMLLQAALGLDIDATTRTVYFIRPRLPEAVGPPAHRRPAGRRRLDSIWSAHATPTTSTSACSDGPVTSVSWS